MPSRPRMDALTLLAESNEQLLERLLDAGSNSSEFRVVEIILSQRQARRQERRIEAAERRASRAEMLAFVSIAGILALVVIDLIVLR